MRRKLTVSLVLIISLFVLNIIGINLIEKTSLVNNNILLANPAFSGWMESGDHCVFCSHQTDGGCTKQNMPDLPLCEFQQ